MTLAATVLSLTAAACTTFAYLPQVIKSWRTRSADDISLAMLTVLATGLVLWFIYGLIITDLALILGNTITLGLVLTVLYVKLRYGRATR